MLVICEPLHFEESLIVGIITKLSGRSVALGTIDRVNNGRVGECEIFDLNRCSYAKTES
jgi:hypothetical protein